MIGTSSIFSGMTPFLAPPLLDAALKMDLAPFLGEAVSPIAFEGPAYEGAEIERVDQRWHGMWEDFFDGRTDAKSIWQLMLQGEGATAPAFEGGTDHTSPSRRVVQFDYHFRLIDPRFPISERSTLLNALSHVVNWPMHSEEGFTFANDCVKGHDIIYPISFLLA